MSVLSSIIWSGLERFSTQGVQFIVGLILARLLLPSDFGLIAILNFFFAISQTVIESGFSNALIQKQNRTDIDLNTAFFLNISIAFFLYLILWGIAPCLSAFYEMPNLDIYMRVYGISIIINSLPIVSKALLTIKLDFRSQLKASLLAALISGGISIFLAYQDWGIWVLIIQFILFSVVNAVLLCSSSKWFPKFDVSVASMKHLYLFGGNYLIASLLHTIYLNLHSLVIGKMYSPMNLGYYSRAEQLVNFPSANLGSVFSRVIYPILCSKQDDRNTVLEIYSRSLRIISFIVFPLMIGFAILAEPFISLFLTDRWLPSAILLQLLCLAMMFDPINSLNIQLLYIKGRTDLALKMEVVKKFVAIIILLFSLPFGLEAICIGRIFYSLIALYLNSYFNSKIYQLKILGEILKLSPYLIASICMGGIVYICIQFLHYIALKLCVGVALGVFVYWSISKIFSFKAYNDAIQILNRTFTRIDF